ncbi:hypothetical protein [Mangrovibacterium sp.]|uniref:hypothetical protein n=1 Tax=Mangrovibacterium sp. TaxID=1961364 RepID=UPI0035697328
MKEEKILEALEAFVKPIVEKCINQALSKEPASALKDPEQFITLQTAEKEFGCKDYMLRKAINNNELSYYQPGRRLFVKRGEVAAWIQSIKVIAKDQPQDYSFLNK